MLLDLTGALRTLAIPAMILLSAVAVIVLATGTGWTVLTAPVTWLRFRFPEKLLCYAAPALFYVAATGLQRLRLKVPLQYLLVILLAGELAWTQAGYFVRLPYAATLEAGRVYDLPAGSRVLTLVSESLLPDFSARDLAGHSREQLKYRYRFAATFYGLESYLGYSPAQLGAHAEINRVFSRGDIDARRKSLVLRNAGVRYVISKIRFSSAARMPRQPLWLPVLSVPHENLQVHEIDGALPRAALFTPAVAARMRTADDLTGDYPFLPVTGLVRTGAGLSCRVATDTPVVLVITSFASPGMELEVDGRRRASGLAFGMFPALPLPPGQHRISFRYRPALLELNLVILFAGLAGCLWCARRWRDGSRDHAADC